jgi:hypothetical protein
MIPINVQLRATRLPLFPASSHEGSVSIGTQNLALNE